MGILFLAGCKNKLDKNGLAAYIQDSDNGLRQDREIGDFKITLTYKPTDLLIEQDDPKVNNDPALREKKRKQYDQYNYFILNMSLGDKDLLYKGSSSKEQFSTSLNRLNFELADYIYATSNQKDTLSLADYYVPNLYGMGGITQILLVFPKQRNQTPGNIEVTIKEMGFGIGTQKFQFKQDDLEKVSGLKISNG
jgi:hypothetical protein